MEILAPQGGVVLYFPATYEIQWYAEDSNLLTEEDCLWYSLNGGTDLILLEDAISDSGSYSWQIPEEQSTEALIQISLTDSFGNYTQESSGLFLIVNPLPDEPQDVQLDISNNVDAVISWQPVTQNIYGFPLTPDGYIVLYSEYPCNQDDHFYYYLGETAGETSFTHYNVVRRRDQMFYKVIAFMDLRGSLADILAPARRDPELKLSFDEIRQTLMGYSFGGER
ncbi:MAG: hypothetical protein R6T89_00830 [Candidatus Syntrophosphaera sp.]